MNHVLSICIDPSSILNSLISAYLFLILIRLVFLGKMYRSFGTYKHPEEETPTIRFRVQYNLLNIISPIPRISIRISREALTSDGEDWKGNFFSDMLKPTHFTGTYVKNIKPNESGWHDVIVFSDASRIAFNLHYIKGVGQDQEWKTSDGYYIVKYKFPH